MTHAHTQPRLIAIAGPKGGIGRSACASALARALNLRDRKVLLVDMSPWGSLAGCVDLPVQNSQKIDDIQPIQTAQKDIFYVRPDANTADEMIAILHNLAEFNDIILDTCAGDDPLSSDLFLRADMPILMADAEPDSIRQTTFWLRQTFIQSLERFPENAEIAEIIRETEDSWTFQSIFERLTPQQQDLFVKELTSFRCTFLLNNRRESSENIQSRTLCHGWGLYLGLHIHFLGSLLFDDKRSFFVRGQADVSQFLREDPIVRELDVICRETRDSMDFEHQTCPAMIQPATQPRSFLRVSTPEEARHAYRIFWEGYHRENGFASQLFSRDECTQIITKLELAYKNSEIAHESSAAVPDTPSITRDISNSFAAAKQYNPEQCSDDAGLWLKSHRESLGFTIAQLSLKTRIPAKILEKLESMEIDNIAPTRLHAYLFEAAKSLNLRFEDVKSKFGL